MVVSRSQEQRLLEVVVHGLGARYCEGRTLGLAGDVGTAFPERKAQSLCVLLGVTKDDGWFLRGVLGDYGRDEIGKGLVEEEVARVCAARLDDHFEWDWAVIVSKAEGRRWKGTHESADVRNVREGGRNRNHSHEGCRKAGLAGFVCACTSTSTNSGLFAGD